MFSKICQIPTQLQQVQAMVSNCEKALKMVSDFLAEADTPKEKEEPKAEVKTETKEDADKMEGDRWAAC